MLNLCLYRLRRIIPIFCNSSDKGCTGLRLPIYKFVTKLHSAKNNLITAYIYLCAPFTYACLCVA